MKNKTKLLDDVWPRHPVLACEIGLINDIVSGLGASGIRTYPAALSAVIRNWTLQGKRYFDVAQAREEALKIQAKREARLAAK